MTTSGIRTRERLLAAVVASLLFLASVLGISRARGAVEEGGPPATAPASPPSPSEPAVPPPTTREPSPSDEAAPSLGLADPDAAAALGAEGLLAVALATAQGPWRDLGHPAWPSTTERPVYVGTVEVGDAPERIVADLVVATRLAGSTDQLVLRFLPAAEALGSGTELSVAAVVDGVASDVTVDRAGARLIVPLGAARPAGEAVLLRFAIEYRLVTVGAMVDDGGPAAFGLLATHPDVATLGHWLPLLTLPGEDGPMVPWGDVGGFPAAIWSLRTVHDGVLVTGGQDGPCPDGGQAPDGRRCSWSRGIALRDVSAVRYLGEPTVAEAEAGGVRHRVTAAVGTENGAEAVLAEVVAAAGSFDSRLGPLAWNEVDTVAVPLGRGAAGMEFPGLSLIDDEQWSNLDGGFGTAVIVHEVAHQWFHALVGNGSLSSPVVDESLAQYLSYLYWRDRFGDGGARAYAERYFLGRYAAAKTRGVEDEPPAQPLDAFSDAETYGVMVYARSPLAWVVAEDQLGVEAVGAFLSAVVDRYGLDTVSDRQLTEDAYAFDPALGAILEEFWFSDEPLG